MGSRREEERNEKIIRGLMKLPPNRKCINCNSVGPQYVCTNFWTFICLSCSGIHREFTHRVKSVSMAKFTTQEVRTLEQGGNQRARDIYLKEWDWQRMRLPVNTNPDRIREFIRAVYVDKKYAGAKSTDKPDIDNESVKSNEGDIRRASSYHSYSQSPPYDFQYEDRRYGKQVDTLARRPSDRALFDGKLGNLLYSPGCLRDQMQEDRFANESSGSRFSDFSASSTGDFRNDVISPSSQDTGYSSPIHHSRNVSSENAQSHRPPNATSQTDFNGVRRSQRTGSSGSFGSFDGSSVSNKSADSGALPDASTERPAQSYANHQTGASPVARSTQLYASQSSINSPVSHTASTKSVQHGGVHMAAAVPSSVSAQPMTFATQDLFDQSMQQPVISAPSIDLFAGFNQQTPPVSHKTGGSCSNSDVAKGPLQVQKALASPSSVPAEALTTSSPVHQDLLSLSTLQEPSVSPPSIDLFAGFDQQLLPMSSIQQSQLATPLAADEEWALFFDTPQHGSSTSVSNMQAEVPAAFPPSDSIAEGIDKSTLPTSPSNASLFMMDQWSSKAEEVQVPVSKENLQSWNAFGESNGTTSSSPFRFDTISQVTPHQFTMPSVPYAEPRSPQDLASSAPERSTPGDIFPGFNASPNNMAAGPSFHGPLQPQPGSMASPSGKSTNPFDMAFESDVVEANDLFMDLTSLQATLPNPHVSADYSGSFSESWISENSTVPYISSGSQGGLSYMAPQVQDTHMLHSAHQGPFPPKNPFE